MKTLSIILMTVATSFGVFNLIEAKKTGRLDKLYQEEVKAENNEQELMTLEVPVTDEMVAAEEQEKPESTIKRDGITKAAKKKKEIAVKTSSPISGEKITSNEEEDELAESLPDDETVSTDAVEILIDEAAITEENAEGEGFELRPEIFSRGRIVKQDYVSVKPEVVKEAEKTSYDWKRKSKTGKNSVVFEDEKAGETVLKPEK